MAETKPKTKTKEIAPEVASTEPIMIDNIPFDPSEVTTLRTSDGTILEPPLRKLVGRLIFALGYAVPTVEGDESNGDITLLPEYDERFQTATAEQPLELGLDQILHLPRIYPEPLDSGTGPLTEPTSAPVNIDAPYVSGTGIVGSTLTCTMGNWDGEPTSYSYRWIRDGVTSVGTSDTYVVDSSNRGHSLTCIVTASNAIGSTDSPPSNAVVVA